jgi:putative RNA 2'-phosphotransferase
MNLRRVSKFLRLVLRHEPAKAGIALDGEGWVNVADLLRGCEAAGIGISHAELTQLVAQNDKQRFAFSEDGTRIRANQGHSLEVNLAYPAVEPPARLFHGTARHRLASIQLHGLTKGSRHHVHLSSGAETAMAVGRRHGEPVVLAVMSAEMASAGHPFFQSANGVWLADAVPPEFLIFP